jgi:hypothetical protein
MMDAERFDTLARSFTGDGSRRRLLSLLPGLTLGALTPLLQPADAEAGKGKKKKKKKKKRNKPAPVPSADPGTTSPPPPPPPPPHPLVTCEMRNDPVCSSEPKCQCATTGLIPETGSQRHCGVYDASSDPCATAPRCPCPEGYVCDLGNYSFGTCPDGGGRCAKNCGW